MVLKLKLDEAVRLQKVLTNELTNIKNDIMSKCKSSSESKINKLIDEWISLSNDLVTLKVKIREANTREGISRKIYERDELHVLRKLYQYIGRHEDREQIESSISKLSKDIEVSNNLTEVEIEIESKTLKNITKNNNNEY